MKSKMALFWIGVLSLGFSFASDAAVISTVPSDADFRAAIKAGGEIALHFNGVISLTNEIEVAKDVSLNAAGYDVQLTVSGGHRLFKVLSGIKFSAESISFSGGRATNSSTVNGDKGGAVLSLGGTLNFNRSTFSNNIALSEGGAISAVGNVFLDGSFLTNNFATGSSYETNSGRPYTVYVPSYGGAISGSNLVLSIKDSFFRGNKAYHGGGIFIQDGVVKAERSDFDQNTATYSGGAALLKKSEARFSAVNWNRNYAFEATVYLNMGVVDFANSTFSSNSAGCIKNVGGKLLVESTIFKQNWGSGGYSEYLNPFTTPNPGKGVIFNEGTALIKDSWFDGNMCTAVGAFYNTGNATIQNTTFSSNTVSSSLFFYMHGFPGYVETPAQGAAVHNAQTALINVENSTFIGNSAVGGQQYLSPTLEGGAIFNKGILLGNSLTVASNFILHSGAEMPANGAGFAHSGGATNARIQNSLFSGNVIIAQRLVTDEPTIESSNFSGAFSDGGWNLSSDSSTQLPGLGSRTNLSLKFADYDFFGGTGPTISLAQDSPAIDAGRPAVGESLDQRGVRRPQGAGFDIGAFEALPQNALYVLPVRSASGIFRIQSLGQPNADMELFGSADLKTWTAKGRHRANSSGLANFDVMNSENTLFFKVVSP